MADYLEILPEDATGDPYLDSFLEEEIEDNFIPVQEDEGEEEELTTSSSETLFQDYSSLYDVPDASEEETMNSFITNFFEELFDESTKEEIRSRWGDYGVQEVGTQKFKNIHEEIVAKESNGRYDAVPIRNGRLVSSAAGKYQFLWNTWGPEINKATGISSKEEFLNNPEAQDYFYHEVYVPKFVLPWVANVKRHLKVNIPDEQLIKLYHFRGEVGALKYLRGQLEDRPEEYNSSISTYTGIKPGKYLKTGGWVYAKLGLDAYGRPLSDGLIDIPEEKQREIANSYSAGFTPLQPPVDINQGVYSIGQNPSPSYVGPEPDSSGLGSPVEESTTIPKPPQGFSIGDAEKVAEVSQKVSNVGNMALNASNSIRDLKGKAMSGALSSISAAANDRMNRLREQQEILKMYQSLQDNFDDSTTDTLGQAKSIWDI